MFLFSHCTYINHYTFHIYSTLARLFYISFLPLLYSETKNYCKYNGDEMIEVLKNSFRLFQIKLHSLLQTLETKSLPMYVAICAYYTTMTSFFFISLYSYCYLFRLSYFTFILYTVMF